jgi:uncharacterized membrane protein
MSYQMINIVYNIYEILQNVFSAVVLCTLTGSLFYVFWIPFSRRIEMEGNPKQAYFILKIVVVAYLFPLMYLVIKGNDGYDIFWGAAYPLQVGIVLISIVWIVGFIKKLGEYYQEHKR